MVFLLGNVDPGGRELVERYLDGEPGAVAQIDQWIERAARSFRRRLSSEWEDVLQSIRVEVFKLLQKGDFRAESHVRTYLWKVTNHSCLDFIRRQERWRWTELSEYGQLLEASSLRAHEVASERETVDLLLRIAAETGEQCRQIWRLLIAGSSYREMSSELGVSEGALRVRALRCRKQAWEIRARLEAEAGG
jgi:RNA polymerase sigma factor (sigma-70 family)